MEWYHLHYGVVLLPVIGLCHVLPVCCDGVRGLCAYTGVGTPMTTRYVGGPSRGT